MCGENSLPSEYGMCVYGKKFGLYRVCVGSFTSYVGSLVYRVGYLRVSKVL